MSGAEADLYERFGRVSAALLLTRFTGNGAEKAREDFRLCLQSLETTLEPAGS